MVEAGLNEKEARKCFYLVARPGLLLAGMKDLQPFQAPFAQDPGRVASWKLKTLGYIDLEDVVANAQPTVLIGTSGKAHAFNEAAVRTMAKRVKRPAIFPLSNPTERSEAMPAELDAWAEGRAVIATGSPFPPLKRDGKEFRIDQNNNAYVYPGIGLGAIAVRARRISDGMFLAAANAIAAQSPTRRDPNANLLPPLTEIRKLSFQVAVAVARQAQKEGCADALSEEQAAAAISAKMWEPVYAFAHGLRIARPVILKCERSEPARMSSQSGHPSRAASRPLQGCQNFTHPPPAVRNAAETRFARLASAQRHCR
jgi:malate dehydrogenase (oxaloacetate-decarboxylating)